jgi:hypothetical protein
VFVTQVGGDSVRFVDAWESFGLKDEIPLLGNETLLDQSLLRNMGAEAEGLISVGHFAEGRDSAETQAFVDEYLAAYDQLPSYYSVATYTAARWIVQALEQVDGDISDMDAFLAAIRAIEFDDTPMGRISLDEYDNPYLTVFVRRVERREDGLLHNVVIDEWENVSQFWTYDPDEFLSNPGLQPRVPGTLIPGTPRTRRHPRVPDRTGGGTVTADAAPVLEFDAVTMQFGGIIAVEDVSLTVGTGARWAVIGPNGAGKTTLFRVGLRRAHPDRRKGLAVRSGHHQGPAVPAGASGLGADLPGHRGIRAADGHRERHRRRPGHDPVAVHGRGARSA